MKRPFFFLAVSAVFSGVALGQTAAGHLTASPNGRHGTTLGPSAAPGSTGDHKGRVVKHVSPPPPTILAHGAARRSTAQTMVARQNHPAPEALPAFQVTSLNGQNVPVTSLQHPGHWLMVYTAPHCVPCESVLQALSASDRAPLKGGAPLVIVVRARSASDVTELRSKYPSLNEAAWVLDQNGDGMKALKLGSLPTLYALYANGVAFTLPGTAGNPLTVEKLAGTWMTRTDHVRTSNAGSEAATTVSSHAAMARPQSEARK